MALRVCFMGTPGFAVPALQSIIDAGHEVVCVYTQPPRPKGRGQQLVQSPVHDLADKYGIPVRTPPSLRKSPEAQEEFAALNLDVAVVAAYGLLLPPRVLTAPKHGCLNIHASLLPRWRGASPIQHAIWKGDAETGVTIMQMEEGLDTGPMIVSSHLPITSTTTTAVLYERLGGMGAQLAVNVLAQIERTGKISATPQPEDGMTYAPLLKKEDGRIDWTQTGAEIECQIRALNPWPGTYVTLADGQVCKILTAEIDDTTAGPAAQGGTPGTILTTLGHIVCGKGTMLRIMQVQAPSGKKMDMAAFINGGYVRIGDIIGS